MSSPYQDMCVALGCAMIANVPTLIIGEPGEGKSSAIYQIGEDIGLNVQSLIASLYDPTEFNGMPYVDPNGAGVKRDPLAWAKEVVRLKNEKDIDSIVFYDELTTAAPTVQAALLRVILEGVVGDTQLPETTRHLAAANPPNIAADGWELSAPLANRFFHQKWDLPVEVVITGFIAGWPKFTLPEVKAEKVLEEFQNAKALIGGFLNRFPEYKSARPANSSEASGAWPSPRSWEMAAKLFGTAIAAKVDDNVKRILVTGCVGETAGMQFLTFAAYQDLPDPEDLLADPESFVVPVDRQDKVWVITANVWAATLRNLTKQRWEACGEILAKVAKAGMADIATLYGSYWAGDNPTTGKRYRPEGAMPSQAVGESLLPILGELGQLLNV